MKGEPDKKFLFTQINIIEGVDIENQLFYQIQTVLSDKILQVCGVYTFIINCCCPGNNQQCHFINFRLTVGNMKMFFQMSCHFFRKLILMQVNRRLLVNARCIDIVLPDTVNRNGDMQDQIDQRIVIDKIMVILKYL